MIKDKVDFYLNQTNQIQRLYKEWKEFGKIIIAIDFDETIYNYHNISGRDYSDVANLLKECVQYGCYIIVWTSCGDDKINLVATRFAELGIPIDKINENMEFIPFHGRKIYYNILLDDRSGLESAFYTLKETLKLLKGIK